jgi:hypothetical protein
MFNPDQDDTRTITINPDAAMSRLRASKDKYIILIDDGGIPIVGGALETEEHEKDFLSRMLDRWYDD